MKGNNPNLCNNWVHTSLHLLLDIAFPFINLKYFVRVLHFDLSQKAEKYYVSGEGGGQHKPHSASSFLIFVVKNVWRK